MAGAGVIDPQVRARVRAALPDAHVDTVLHDNGKAVVLSGAVGSRRAVVKVLIEPDPFWVGKFAAEVATYRAFEVAPPPVPVPRLLGADPDAGVLATTWLPGLPVHTDRYPTHLDTTKVALLVEVASRLQIWRPPAGRFSSVFDYPARYTRYQRLGLLDQSDVTALSVLTEAAGSFRMAHGGLLPANVLHQPPAAGAPPVVTGLLDFEFTGLFLPCFDLALLWVLLGNIPDARSRVTNAVGTDQAELAGFWVNVAMVTTRELRTHGELEPDHPLRSRLPLLTATWAQARARLHETAAAL
jgi:hypothetical protein